MSDKDTKPRLRRYLPAFVYASLLAIGIPWYWPSDNLMTIAGFPGWVIVAISVSFVASVYTAWLLSRPWPQESADNKVDELP